jgi:hypothetical protein
MFLIITPSQFSEALLPLKQHKESTGMLTSIVTLEKAFQDYSGRDEAEKVKRCIEDYHRQQYIRYVMLVGDFSIFPVRYTVTDRKSDAALNTAFYPTDLYYSALYKADGSFDDWDGNKNGYYGELFGECHSGPVNVDNVSLEPVVAVGRIPASNAEEVTRYVNKIINYETNAYKESSKKRAMLMATHDWLSDACKVNERIAEEYLTDYECVRMNTEGCLCSSDRVLASDKITDMINRGIDIVNYIGFGDPGSLTIPEGPWKAADAAQLTNSKLPIMCVSIGSTSVAAAHPPYSPYVDINGESHPGLGRGEIFEQLPPQPACRQRVRNADGDLATNLTVRSEHGAIAYIGGTTGMQMYEPTEYFFQSVQASQTIGEAWQGMIRRFYKVQGLPGKLNQQYWFAVAKVHQPWRTMLFGDPSLRIRGAASGKWFDRQITRTDLVSSEAPALGVLRDKLYMSWKGKTGPNLWFSVFDGERWSAHRVTSDDHDSSGAPALAAYKNKLYMVWKGKESDPLIWFSTFDGAVWTRQRITRADRSASFNPSLAVYEGKLYMAWKARGNYPQLWHSYYDGDWSPQKMILEDHGASSAPALVVFQDKLYMFWRGKADAQIWYSVTENSILSDFDEARWSPGRVVDPKFETSDAPALAVYRDKLYMVWKGNGQARYSVFDGDSWTPQQEVGAASGISKAPALAVYDDKLFMTWGDSDQQLWLSYFYVSP